MEMKSKHIRGAGVTISILIYAWFAVAAIDAK